MIPKEAKVLIGIAVVVLIGGVVLFLNTPGMKEAGKPVDSKSLIRESSHMTGTADAPGSVVEFGDYQCPACGIMEPVVEQIMTQYKDNPKFNFVFRNFPLPGHPNAQITAEAAEAAGAQGKFWEMHHLLYASQEQWVNSPDPTIMLVNYATQIGVADITKFESDLKNHVYRDIVLADKADGENLQVNATPTFFIGGEKLDLKKLPSKEELVSKIEEALNN